ncbi:MAG: SHOCT domain-containing protein, partial [Anaerolineae bacterium]
DKSLSGWGKAAWLLFLVVSTLLGLLVYVIVRGKGMAERSMKEQVEAKESFDAYVRDVAGGGAASELEKAASMHAAGQISDAEYQALKARILG